MSKGLNVNLIDLKDKLKGRNYTFKHIIIMMERINERLEKLERIHGMPFKYKGKEEDA